MKTVLVLSASADGDRQVSARWAEASWDAHVAVVVRLAKGRTREVAACGAVLGVGVGEMATTRKDRPVLWLCGFRAIWATWCPQGQDHWCASEALV